MLEYFASEYNKSQQVMPFSIDTYVKTYWLEQYKGIYMFVYIYICVCVYLCGYIHICRGFSIDLYVKTYWLEQYKGI
jgi:hypothetical protein